MYKFFILFLTVLALPSLVLAQEFEVTVTNLTKGQSFTPIAAVVHDRDADVFEVGTKASAPLEAIAEEGSISELETALDGSSDVASFNSTSGLLAPGQTATFNVQATRRQRLLSLVSMLIPTNDTFLGLDSYRLPRKGTSTVYLFGYDAGTEVNDELCASIPGPSFTECGGAGGGAAVVGGEEGYVYISNGIQGTGDLTKSLRDWRNPVAKVTIRRVRKS